MDRYEILHNKLKEIVSELEAEQIDRGVGMTRAGDSSEDMQTLIEVAVHSKLDSHDVTSFAKTYGYSTVQEVIEFASEMGLFAECNECLHMKALHLDLKGMRASVNRGQSINDFLGRCTAGDCKCPSYQPSRLGPAPDLDEL